MATPMFRDLSRALEAPEEGRELWSGVPVEEEPAYAEELFRKASDAALARENALAKTGYVPAGTGPVVEPSLDSTLAAMPSGLRSRKPLDFMPDTTKLQGKLAGFLGGDRLLQGPGYARPLSDEDLAAETERATRLMSEDAGRPIPTASAPVTKDAIAPVASVVPSTGPQTPAGKPESMGTPGLPAPSSEGAGGDVLGRLGLGQALVRALEGSGSIIAGRDLRSGAAETLGERMKQIEALRAKREEQGLEQQRERATWGASNRATLASFMAQYKDRPEVVEALRAQEPGADTTKPSDFLKNIVGSLTTPPRIEGIQATTKKTGAQTVVAEKQPIFKEREVKVKEGTFEERKRAARASEAIRWAALNQAAKQAASKLTEGRPDAFRKEVNDKAQVLGTAVAKEYGEIASALQEADRALIGMKGVSPDLFAKVAQATKLDTLNTPEERALFRSIGELRRSAQKAQSGLAVTEPERQEFLQTFGQNWTQDPRTLLEAVEWMRRKTRDKLDTSFATYRAQGDVGNTAIRAYEQAGGVTPNAEYLKPFSERAPKAAGTAAPAPAAQVGGMVKVRHKATGKTATVDRAKADEMLKRPDFEEVK